jgi:diaminopimelate epimerase
VLGPNHIRVRTFERGVEGETLACGTGVSGVCAGGVARPSIHLAGQGSGAGRRHAAKSVLTKPWARFADVKLNGPADFVFKGTI